MHLPADDATLADALESANLPALLPAIVQLTGDMSLLEINPLIIAADGNLMALDATAACRRCPRPSSCTR